MANEIATALVAELNASSVGVRQKNEVAYADIGTATATNPSTVAGAATISKMAGIVTTNVDVNSAGLAIYTLTLTNTLITTGTVILATAWDGTNTQGSPVVSKTTPLAGSCTIVIRNTHATEAFNGSLKISFAIFPPISAFSVGAL
jgi:hypothetical protein